MKRHARLLGTILLGLASALSHAQAPVPFINLPLVPDATAPGGGDFILTVNGTGFVSNSTVNWNGTALATQFVSGSQLTATVPAANIATASTGWVTVVNPAPGGGTSSVAFFTVTAKRGNTLAFTLGSSPAAGSGPVAVGDFNSDGKLDMAVANSNNTVSILLGDGTGNFTLASSPATGAGPSSIAVGDFNGDGKQDLAVTNACGSDPNCQSSGTVSILLGDGAGNFTLASSPDTGLQPSQVVVGDFNGDGKLDLAVADYPFLSGQGTVFILLGDGAGNFPEVSTLAVYSFWPNSLAVGDFNQDGQLDLATFGPTGSAYGIAPIFLGDGKGNFTLASTPEVHGWGYAIVAGDFNGDGKLDLATADWFVSRLSILLGDGTGQFTLAAPIPAGQTPQAMAAGDFNGDGKLDLAVVVGNDRTTNIMLGDGTGGFGLAASVGYMVYPGAVTVGDFNRDGLLDVATSDGYTNSVLVYLQVPVSAAVTFSPSSLTFGTQLVGTSSNPQPVTLTNSGGAPLKVTTIAAHGTFSQTNNCPSKVLPGGQCTINVAFAPPTWRTHTGSLTIRDNAVDSPQTVSLTGVGTAMTLLPASLDFGSQPVGTTSPPQVVTLTNYDQATVNISRIRLTGSNPAVFAQTNTCGSSVPAGGSCTISVTFAPKYYGYRTATLEVNDNGGASPQTVALSGNGTR